MATGTILLPGGIWVPDASSPPDMRVEDGRIEWLFDAGTDEILYVTFRMPQDYASGGTFKALFKMASATSGSVVWAAAVMAVRSSSPGSRPAQMIFLSAGNMG